MEKKTQTDAVQDIASKLQDSCFLANGSMLFYPSSEGQDVVSVWVSSICFFKIFIMGI